MSAVRQLGSAVLLLALLFAAGPARAEEIVDEIPPHAGAPWAWGFRCGAEMHVGEVASRRYSVFPRPAGAPTSDKLFEGINVAAFLERTLQDHARLGLEIGVMDAVAGELTYERDFTTLHYGPYLRLSALPGRISPYLMGAAQIYHGFAKGPAIAQFPALLAAMPAAATYYPLGELNNPVGFTWALGGGLEFPITQEFTFAVDSRYRRFLQGGADPKVVELTLMVHVWMK